MRKIILIGISFLLLACSTLSINDLTAMSNTPAAPQIPTPNTTLIALYVQATILASQITNQNTAQTPTPPQGCVQLPCPTCAAVAEVNSPILPAPPTISVPVGSNSTVADSKPTEMPSSTPPPVSAKPFQIQANMPVYLSNFAHQDKTCNWMGVAGQVFDLSGNPLKNMVIMVNGNLNGTSINEMGLTGMTKLYGPNGYEIVLGNAPVASTATLTLSVYGLDGVALSDPIPFNTIADCQKNLTLINFHQVR